AVPNVGTCSHLTSLVRQVDGNWRGKRLAPRKGNTLTSAQGAGAAADTKSEEDAVLSIARGPQPTAASCTGIGVISTRPRRDLWSRAAEARADLRLASGIPGVTPVEALEAR